MGRGDVGHLPDRAYIPGNKMAFAGIRNGQERANLIAYLEKATAAQ